MSIARAEQLKRDLTDKYVVVRSGVPELQRFQGRTGTVKTVNMSCRALVEFESEVDIGWYDIDPGYLTVIDQPLPKKVPAAHAEKPAKGTAPAAKAAPAAKPASGGSPLDLIRKGGAAKPAEASAGGKPSPLDLIRKAGAAKPQVEAAPAPVATAEAPEAAAAATAPAPAAEPAPPAKPPADTAGLSPLELIRRQGAAKR